MPHQRKKSGHTSTNTSMTDVRKAVVASDTRYKRPVMSRRQTPVSAHKLGRSTREREREREWHESWEDERESFPQFCMTCEKQFVPHDDKFLYCSETCRRVDQNSTSPAPSMRTYASSHAFYSAGSPEPKDIIPRASPSRPSSMLLANSPPTTPGSYYPQHYHHTSAISALRSLNVRPPSPPSPTGSTGGSIWPFSRSAATSPSNSYTRSSSTAGFFSSTYDAAYAPGAGAYTYDVGPGRSDRPLPSRHPAGSSSRPKSIELVTPMGR